MKWHADDWFDNCKTKNPLSSVTSFLSNVNQNHCMHPNVKTLWTYEMLIILFPSITLKLNICVRFKCRILLYSVITEANCYGRQQFLKFVLLRKIRKRAIFAVCITQKDTEENSF